MKPVGWRMALMQKRRSADYAILQAERYLRRMQLKETRQPELATLIGRLGRTFESSMKSAAVNNAQTVKDPFTFNVNARNVRLFQEGKWNPDDPAFAHGAWCCDTPGAVNENQVINQLAHSLRQWFYELF